MAACAFPTGRTRASSTRVSRPAPPEDNARVILEQAERVSKFRRAPNPSTVGRRPAAPRNPHWPEVECGPWLASTSNARGQFDRGGRRPSPPDRQDDAGTLAQPNDTELIAPKLSAQHGHEPPATACWSHLLVPWLPCVVPWGCSPGDPRVSACTACLRAPSPGPKSR